MSTTEFYTKLKNLADSRETITIPQMKVQNRFLRYADIFNLFCGMFTQYEIKQRIRMLERDGKVMWSFRHKKYIVK